MRRATISEPPSDMIQKLNYVPFRQRNNQLSPKYSMSSKGSMFSFKSPQHVQKDKILSNAKSQPTIVTLTHHKETNQKQESQSSKQDFIIQNEHERINKQNTQKETQIVNNSQIEDSRKIQQNVTQITEQIQENKIEQNFQQEQKMPNESDEVQEQVQQAHQVHFIEEPEPDPVQMLPMQTNEQIVLKKPEKSLGKFSSLRKFPNKNNFFKKLQTTTKKAVKPNKQLSNPESKVALAKLEEKQKENPKERKNSNNEKFQEIMKNLKNGNKAASSKFSSQIQSSDNKSSKLLKRFKKKNEQ